MRESEILRELLKFDSKREIEVREIVWRQREFEVREGEGFGCSHQPK